jgi:hypothetical protein
MGSAGSITPRQRKSDVSACVTPLTERATDLAYLISSAARCSRKTQWDTPMTSVRYALLTALVGFGALAGSAQMSPASAGKWDWVNNKPYVDCLKLFYYGDFLAPKGQTPAQQAARKEKGRQYCNRTYGY